MTFGIQGRLDSASIIAVMEPFRTVNASLLELTASFQPDDWTRPTVHKDRSVKDLTAHLLHGSVRRISSIRDRYRPPTSAQVSSADDLTRFIQEDNLRFMGAMAGVSPRMLCELIAQYDPELIRLFEGMDPYAPGLGVVWAGEWQSSNWFDIAREYTEKWHHQQQLRDATGRPPLYEKSLLVPVLETFARGLPHAYRGLAAPDGTRIALGVTAPADIGWTIVRESGAWSLWEGCDPESGTRITASPDVLWRVWTKGISPGMARDRLEIIGPAEHVAPLLDFVAIMA